MVHSQVVKVSDSWALQCQGSRVTLTAGVKYIGKLPTTHCFWSFNMVGGKIHAVVCIAATVHD
jgi:hypothetical protein